MTKDGRIAVRVGTDLKKWLEKAADAEHRSVSSYVELVLREHAGLLNNKRGKRQRA